MSQASIAGQRVSMMSHQRINVEGMELGGERDEQRRHIPGALRRSNSACVDIEECALHHCRPSGGIMTGISNKLQGSSSEVLWQWKGLVLDQG